MASFQLKRNAWLDIDDWLITNRSTLADKLLANTTKLYWSDSLPQILCPTCIFVDISQTVLEHETDPLSYLY